jgi:hypothetical protein
MRGVRGLRWFEAPGIAVTLCYALDQSPTHPLSLPLSLSLSLSLSSNSQFSSLSLIK